MPKLKDYLVSDLTTFFNPDEFAEMHNIDGKEVPATVDSDILKIRSENKTDRYDGVYSSKVAVFVRAADLPSRPVFGQHLRLDGKLYLVTECTEDEGVLEIDLGVNES